MSDYKHWAESIPAKYQPIPFWSWNDRLDPEELKKQIHWMHNNGIGGFFMHARGGLKTPYLGSEWMQAIEACCDEAKKLGMHPWAYDENGWPSGFAGGKLLENPENRDMYITYSQGVFDGKADVSYGLTEDCLIRTLSGTGFAEYLNLYFHTSASTADILNPEVVKQFLALTHEQYKTHFGENFNANVAGFFTDEPQYYRAATPYTKMLSGYFAEKYGVDILDRLGLLFVEKDGYRTFRYRYWLAMQDLMLNSFAQQVYLWCDQNGTKLTGHYVEETTLGAQMMCCAGAMPFYEFEHIPGIDWLGSKTDNELSPRQLGSAARQLGKKQAITETFGCCGWNISPAELKRIAGFQYACGANLMCHHLLPYSEHGQRKRDYPAHFHPINPWIDALFKDFNDYFTRLGYLLANSEEPVSVAMLHPIRSAYLEHKREREASDGFPACDLDQDLHEACRSLSARGIAYHFLDETLLERHGFVEGNRIGCGQCTYDYLVLPNLLTMGAHTETLLHRFVAGGGKVLLLAGRPEYLEGSTYSYDYLASTCTMEDILQAQPFAVQNPDTALYYTYRTYEDKPFLFIQNGSESQGYSQAFSFRENWHSFIALDLLTGQTKALPLTVHLEKNESLLLFPVSEEPPICDEAETLKLRFQDACVTFDRNFLTIDAVQYSTDGIHYSETLLCSDLCQKLLEQRYEGKVWLRYAFDVQTVPEEILLLSEKSGQSECSINGHRFAFEKMLEAEPGIAIANIAPYIQPGINCYEFVLDWHQSEETYYALFGEGVTESLKNCIAYDSEIEAVYLAGKFGVYSYDAFKCYDNSHVIGHSFYIGQVPQKATEPVTDGFPFFRGDLTLTQDVHLTPGKLRLALEGDYLSAKVAVNGQRAGTICFENTLDISPWVHEGENQIQVTFTIGNRNLLGPFHSLEETFICPDSFLRNDLPNATGDAPMYKFRLFYENKR